MSRVGLLTRFPCFALPALVLGVVGCPQTESKQPGAQDPAVPTSVNVARVSPSGDPSVNASAAVAASSATPVPSASASARESGAIPSPMNVIVLSIDSLRSDMPWAGYPRPIAPRLTELEKKSVNYTRSYAVSSYTSMSVGALLGGRIPSELTRSGYFFGQYPEDERNLFLPKVLRQAKVKTIGVQSHAYFAKGRSGFEQGFETWELTPGIKFDNTTDNHVTSPKTVELMKKVLGDPSLANQQFFAWTHFTDPHDVYMKHEGINWGKSERDKYDGEITFTDRHVGMLLDFIAEQSWAPRTAIIITSDHGEGFGEHGRMRHGFEIWEHLVRVPLFVYYPGIKARRIDEPRSALDIAPTIADLMGVASPPSFVGKSLRGELLGGKAEPRDVILDLPATSDNDKKRALVRGTFKLLCSGNDKNCKLYDLAADPTEDKPIAKGEKFQELMTAYTQYVATLKEVPPTKCRAGCLNGAYHKK